MLLTGLNLEAGPGDAVRLTGPNGVGKSSLIRVFAGLLQPLAGELQVGGRVTLADEGLALDRNRSLQKALGFWADLDSSDDLDNAIEAMGLAHLAQVPVRLFSTGQLKRAALARIVTSGAPIWLLDEPGNGLDSDGIARLESVIEAHRAGGGMVIFASHFPLKLAKVKEIDLSIHVPADEPA